MNVSEGEPPLKRRHQKRTIVAESNVVCGLTHHQWFDLILQRLLLEDLITVKRTCKTFAAFKRLRSLIKDKEYTAFEGIDKKFWNRQYPYSRFVNERHNGADIMLEHEGQFVLWSEYHDEQGMLSCFLGVYSNKRKLRDAFLRLWKAAPGTHMVYSFPFGYMKGESRPLLNKWWRVYMTGLTQDELQETIKYKNIN